MKRIAIIGLGLMGGSLGLAVKRRLPRVHVAGYARRAETRRKALRRGAVDSAHEDPVEAAKGADLVVLCLPVLLIPVFARLCRPHLRAGCVVTDVGSTKAELGADLGRVFRDGRATFVGSHPIAGSDETGLESARGDLYENAVVVVTPPGRGRATARATARVKGFWKNLGARIVVMSPGAHDRIIARTSHLPHLVAAALVSNLYRDGRANAGRLCGPGFRDTTRIAGGSEAIWHDIVKTNRAAVERELAAFGRALDQVRAMIRKGAFEQVRRFLSASRRKRRRFEREFGERGTVVD